MLENVRGGQQLGGVDGVSQRRAHFELKFADDTPRIDHHPPHPVVEQDVVMVEVAV